MSEGLRQRWQSSNEAYLTAELRRIEQALVRHLTPAKSDAAPDRAAHDQQLANLAAGMPAPPALVVLRELYELSPFEVDVLLLCAGFECSAAIQTACVQGRGGLAHPSFGLALAALEHGHFSAMISGGPLRRERLIRFAPGPSITSSALRIDERVLCYLLGLPSIDALLRPLLREVAVPAHLVPSQHALVERTRALALVELEKGDERAALWLCGPDAVARRAVAAQVCGELHLTLFALRATDVPQNPSEREELLAVWEREQFLTPIALLLCYGDGDSPETLQAARAWLDLAAGLVLVTSREVARAGERPIIRLDVPRPSRDEQVELWRSALGDTAVPLNDAIEQMASQFQLGMSGILTASAHALGQVPATVSNDPSDDTKVLGDTLWAACRNQVRPRLDELAQRIDSDATWKDLVLPEAQESALRKLVAHQRHQSTVYHRWGFARTGSRGLGVTALFVGQSGTGKTLAAEVIAHALALDLYRIDLSQIISKYIGETEKNLRRVFDAAEEGGAVLLFDEADAIFGKRTEVKDSHDRYANIEISYLLQRMETYQGVSILTSNMRSALDSAFIRRLRFIVQFPFPDVQQRAELWRRVLPSRAPQSGLNPDKLARLTVAGGHIRNIALGAAFLAAEESEPLAMRHMLQAARSEYAKLERPITEAEIGGWV